MIRLTRNWFNFNAWVAFFLRHHAYQLAFFPFKRQTLAMSVLERTRISRLS